MYILETRNNNIIIIIIFNIITILLVSVYSIFFNDLAYLTVFICFYIIFLMVIGYSNSREVLYIFSMLLPIYLLFSLLIAFDYENSIGVQYGYADESLFYYLGLYNHLEMLPNNFRFVAAPPKYISLIDFTAYFEFIKSLGDFFHYIGYQSFMAFKLTSVFGGIFGIIIFFNISKLFFNIKEAQKIAILFGLLPLIIYHSSVFMRDILIFSLSVYQVFLLLTITKKKMSILIIVMILLFLLRPENGIFMFGVTFVYILYIVLWKNFNKLLVLITVFIIIVMFYLLFQEQILYSIDTFTNVHDGYNARGQNSASASSLVMKIKSLPFPINDIFVFLTSQISPFPFWALAVNSYSPIIEGLGGFIWFFAWPFVVLALVKNSIRNRINTKLLFIFFIFLVYIFLVANIQAMHRRLIVGYPFVFLIAYYGYKYSSSRDKRIIFLSSTMILVLLYVIYFFLKGL